MLRRKSIISMVAALFLTAGFMAGCSDNDDNNGNPVTGGGVDKSGKTIAQVIQEDSDLSIFAEAVEKAGLMDQLNNKDQKFTVFAPTNEAFNIKYPTEEALEAFLNDSAEAVVRYHIIPYREIEADKLAGESPLSTYLANTEIRAADVPVNAEVGEDDEEGEEANNQTTAVVLNYGQATIIEPNTKADNGIIHEIDRVLNIRSSN